MHLSSQSQDINHFEQILAPLNKTNRGESGEKARIDILWVLSWITFPGMVLMHDTITVLGVTQLTFIIERSIYVDSTNNIRASNETAIRC